MDIFKFGGASVKDAEGVRNLFNIINTRKDNLIIVVSAMGKMTDALEVLCNAYFHKTEEAKESLQHIIDFHRKIISDLFGSHTEEVDAAVGKLYRELQEILNSEPSLCYDYEYDRIICFGELLSTTIIAYYLEKQGRKAKFVDIRKCLITDQNYRNACINPELSAQLCRKAFTFQDTFMYITQGFIAGTTTNQTTTLGREGSDYTAALLANLLDAENVTIWKDVPGIMNADPKSPRQALCRLCQQAQRAKSLVNYLTKKPLNSPIAELKSFILKPLNPYKTKEFRFMSDLFSIRKAMVPSFVKWMKN